MSKRKAKKANNLSTPIGEHFTIQKVINDGEKMFGFAVNDSGENAFIPRPIIIQYKMTEDDIGAGFTAPTRGAATNQTENGLPQIQVPLTWDGVEEEDDHMEVLLEKLDSVAQLIGAADHIAQELKAVHQWINDNYPAEESSDAI